MFIYRKLDTVTKIIKVHGELKPFTSVQLLKMLLAYYGSLELDKVLNEGISSIQFSVKKLQYVSCVSHF